MSCCHITELKLLQDINVYCIDVLGKLYSLQYVFVHKAAYNHCYMNKTFGHNEQNPILRYNNKPVPLTGDGNIEMTYLKALIDLQPKKYGISTWLHKTGVYKYTIKHNLTAGVSEVLHIGEITKQMGSQIEQKLHDMWFTTFCDLS